MRLLLFILLNILLSPLIILGLIVYFYRLRRHSIPYRRVPVCTVCTPPLYKPSLYPILTLGRT